MACHPLPRRPRPIRGPDIVRSTRRHNSRSRMPSRRTASRSPLVRRNLTTTSTLVLRLSKGGPHPHCRGSTSSPLGWRVLYYSIGDNLAAPTALVLSLSKGGPH